MSPLDAFFESYYRLRPVNATFTGAHEHDHRLPDWSPAGLEAAADEMTSLRRDLGAAENGSDIDVQLADAFLEIQIEEHRGNHFQRGNPALYTGEAAFGVISLMTREFAPAAGRIDAVVERLEAIPSFLADAPRSIRGPVPAEWTRRAARECGGALALLESMGDWLRSCGAERAPMARVQASAARAAGAFQEFRRWCERHDAAPMAAYACGPDLYDLLLHRGHWCARARADLLADARSRIEEAAARLDELARHAAPGGWPDVQARLAARHPRVTGYLDRYAQLWEECRHAAEQHDLVSWPDAPIRYVPIPTFARAAAPSLYYLFYRSPAPLDAIPVHDYEVTPIEPGMPAEQAEALLRATNDSVIKLNHVVHHGALGHHVQNYWAYRAPSRIGRVAAVDGASRIGMFCGGSLAEGWACYATDLMEEAGFLSELERVAEQHTRVRLLARAVVDIELHQGSMTFDEAVAFYEQWTGMATAAARAEVVKNSMFPGTAIMYWLGTQTLHELRAQRQAVEGSSFSLRAFHDELLGFGAIPARMIAQLMHAAPAA